MLWQSGDSARVEAIKKQAADWTVTELKSKLSTKRMQRKNFDELSFAWRAAFVKAGGKVFD